MENVGKITSESLAEITSKYKKCEQNYTILSETRKLMIHTIFSHLALRYTVVFDLIVI